MAIGDIWGQYGAKMLQAGLPPSSAEQQRMAIARQQQAQEQFQGQQRQRLLQQQMQQQAAQQQAEQQRLVQNEDWERKYKSADLEFKTLKWMSEAETPEEYALRVSQGGHLVPPASRTRFSEMMEIIIPARQRQAEETARWEDARELAKRGARVNPTIQTPPMMTPFGSFIDRQIVPDPSQDVSQLEYGYGVSPLPYIPKQSAGGMGGDPAAVAEMEWHMERGLTYEQAKEAYRQLHGTYPKTIFHWNPPMIPGDPASLQSYTPGSGGITMVPGIPQGTAISGGQPTTNQAIGEVTPEEYNLAVELKKQGMTRQQVEQEIAKRRNAQP
jgi:hypothetical protein